MFNFSIYKSIFVGILDMRISIRLSKRITWIFKNMSKRALMPRRDKTKDEIHAYINTTLIGDNSFTIYEAFLWFWNWLKTPERKRITPFPWKLAINDWIYSDPPGGWVGTTQALLTSVSSTFSKFWKSGEENQVSPLRWGGEDKSLRRLSLTRLVIPIWG